MADTHDKREKKTNVGSKAEVVRKEGTEADCELSEVCLSASGSKGHFRHETS